MTDLIKQESGRDLGAILEKVVIKGDLKSLTPEERVSYYIKTCESLGLNPVTRPFEYMELQGKLTLYARRECAEQLRKLYKISCSITDTKVIDDIYIVTAEATNPEGRTDASTGAVNIKGLAGVNKANAFLICETKAKRRVTLSICGLGMLDENEVDSIPHAEKKTGATVEVVEVYSEIESWLALINDARDEGELKEIHDRFNQDKKKNRYSGADISKYAEVLQERKKFLKGAWGVKKQFDEDIEFLEG